MTPAKLNEALISLTGSLYGKIELRDEDFAPDPNGVWGKLGIGWTKISIRNKSVQRFSLVSDYENIVVSRARYLLELITGKETQ